MPFPRNLSLRMPEEMEQGRWYWHCPACGAYVAREQARCACGAPKVRRSASPTEPAPADRRIAWEAGALLLVLGLGALWLLLE